MGPIGPMGPMSPMGPWAHGPMGKVNVNANDNINVYINISILHLTPQLRIRARGRSLRAFSFFGKIFKGFLCLFIKNGVFRIVIEMIKTTFSQLFSFLEKVFFS